MAILPAHASAGMRDLTGAEWKVYSYYLSLIDLKTWRSLDVVLDVPHDAIARDTSVEITHVSVVKKSLEGKGWIKRFGKWRVELLIGVEELRRVRDKMIEREVARFGASPRKGAQVGNFQRSGGEQGGATLGNSKGNSVDLGNFQTRSLEIPKDDLYKDQEVEDQKVVAAATARDKASRDAWKQEQVTQAFLDGLVSSGMFSREVVAESWRELAFAVSQRGPDERGCKGELIGFCRAKLKTGTFAGMAADVVKLQRGASARATSGAQVGRHVAEWDCTNDCPLCFGGQRESTPQGARDCPNRVARRAEIEGRNKQTNEVQT